MAASDLGLRFGFSDFSSCSMNSDLVLKNKQWPCTDVGFVFKGKSKRGSLPRAWCSAYVPKAKDTRATSCSFSPETRVSRAFSSAPSLEPLPSQKFFLAFQRRHVLYSLRLKILLWLRCPLEKRPDLEPFGPKFNPISFIIIQWTPVGGPYRGKMKTALLTRWEWRSEKLEK